MRRLVFFEDSQASEFAPLTVLRPVFELLCGHFSQRERVLLSRGDTDWGAVIRPELAEVYRETHPAAHVNDRKWLFSAPALWINGRWLATPADVEQIPAGAAVWIDDVPVALWIEPSESQDLDPGSINDDDLLRLARGRKAVQGNGLLLRAPWDLIARNPVQLTEDFALHPRPASLDKVDDRVAILGRAEEVFVDATARLDPFVVLDATSGPIWIDANARLQAFTRIEGPAYIGRDTQLFRANVREGCSFGPVCRLGGEIEESIVHGYANKYHDGFLGHSYVCPWVNLGALTTNSDLKNDYSTVRVPGPQGNRETGSTKVGAFIGDHTKTALCSLFNTGSHIGIMSQILPGGELLPKYIPSFSRMWHGRLEELPDGCESALQTARVAMSRRNIPLSPAMERLLREAYDRSEPERQAALARRSQR